jgi:hypothetical protein
VGNVLDAKCSDDGVQQTEGYQMLGLFSAACTMAMVRATQSATSGRAAVPIVVTLRRPASGCPPAPHRGGRAGLARSVWLLLVLMSARTPYDCTSTDRYRLPKDRVIHLNTFPTESS